MTERADVLVVGGGLVGCAVARELAGRGLSVTLLERGKPGEEASWAAAGLLSPQSDARGPGPFVDLGVESRGMYPAWTAELEAETGIPVGYRRLGILRCAFGPEELDRLARRFAWQEGAGLPLERLDGRAAADVSGLRIAPEVSGGIFFPEDGAVDNRRLARAAAAAAERRGARLLLETPALGFLVSGGRCTGVRTKGSTLSAGAVIDAAGAWAAFDRDLPLPVPVEPVRGQIVALRLAGPMLPTVIESEAVYLVPRGEGTVLAGATVERVGFRKEVTAGGVRELAQAAIALVPTLAQAPFLEAWAGLRPGTPDGLPLLGRTAAVDGLIFATGHYRNGILLAPVTARLVADLVDGRSTRDLSAFSPDRFAPASGRTPTEAVGQFG